MRTPRLLFPVLTLALICSCSSTAEPTASGVPPIPATATQAPAPTSTSAPMHAVPEDSVMDQAAIVVDILRQRAMDQLATYVHPEVGVRFSPYAYVRETDLRFSADRVPDLLADDTVYLWGAYDGSGEPIELTFAQYYDRFVYDQDFANAEQIAFNRRIGGEGGTIDNIEEFYPGALMVEFHFSGFDPDYGGLDWRSLRLVFMQHEGEWLLVGIVHDEWTT